MTCNCKCGCAKKPEVMTVSDEGLEYLSTAEGGYILYVYDDHVGPKRYRKGAPVRGFLTIGLGHLIMDSDPLEQWLEEGISYAEARTLHRKDLGLAEAAVTKHVTVPLEQHQFDALCSFAFNVGETQFRTSTLLRKLNQGDYASVVPQLKRWRKSGGKVLRGLEIRRRETGQLFSEADYDYEFGGEV